MQKSFEIKSVKPEHFSQLKALWLICFPDEAEVVLNNFFEKSVTSENVIATFFGDRIVNAMFLLESEVVLNNKGYSAIYIYGVCTHPEYRGKGLMKTAFKYLDELAISKKIDYLFLVPATESLFDMYKRLGFETGFTYEKTKVDFNEIFFLEEWCESLCLEKLRDDFTFEEYLKFRKRFCSDISGYAILKGKAFDSFYAPSYLDVRLAHNSNGYCVYNVGDETITIFEHFCEDGCRFPFYCVVADDLGYTVDLRKPSLNANGIPFGMYKSFGDVPRLENAFFGVPYGG